ncbi:hypothetical protein D9M68_703090 [compost metagenome]
MVPANTPKSCALTLPSSLTDRVTRSSTCCAVALSPAPVTRMSPWLTLKPPRLPSARMKGRPVVSVTRSVLMNPHPEQVMPYGLASTTSALPPSTSVKPASVLRLFDTTSFRITRAALVWLKLAVTWPASCDCQAICALVVLFRISPIGLTLKLWNWLCESPAALAWLMLTTVTPLGAT